MAYVQNARLWPMWFELKYIVGFLFQTFLLRYTINLINY